MNGDKFIEQQKQRLLKAQERAFKLAVFDAHKEMGVRIFINGQDANDKQIGQYNSTNPIYVNPKNSPRKFPTGKLKNGNPRKTKRFNSYRDFRAAVGRKVDKVNLNLFGNLQNNFITGLRKSKNGYESILTNQENVGKSLGAEQHFGTKIFQLSQAERQQFFETIKRETFLILQGRA